MISVIMPTFMHEQFIARAIQSVQCQTYKDWELIVVNDGSSDATESIVNQFLIDSRIHYIYQDNSGPSCARNKGLEHSNGDYIAYLDSDDIYLANHLEVRHKMIKEHDVDLVFGPVWDIKPSLRKIYHGELADTDTGCVLPLMVMHKRFCLSVGLFDSNIVFEEDLDLFLRMKKYYKVYQFFDPVTAEYYVHNHSIHRMYEKGGQKYIEDYRNHRKRT